MPLAIHSEVFIVYEITFYARLTFGPVIAAIYKIYYLFKFGTHENVVGIRQWWPIQSNLIVFNVSNIGPIDHINKEQD